MPASPLNQLIVRLRRSTRWHAFGYGLTRLFLELGVWFFVSLILDKTFEPSVTVREIFLTVSAVWFIRSLIVHIVLPTSRSISDESMAVLYAKTFPEQAELILTAVHPANPDGQDAQLWSQTVEKANQLAEKTLNSGRLFIAFDNKRRLHNRLKVAGLILCIVAIHLYNTTWLPTWFNRVVCLSNELWPRQAKIWVDGFDQNANNPIGRIKIARGDDLDLRVLADVSRPVVPNRITMDYRDENGVRRYATMTRQGEINTQSKRPLPFTYTLRGVLNSLVINFRGADAQLKGLYVDVVESPVIVKAQMRLTYPKYMNKKDRIVNVSTANSIPLGTKVTLILTANKPLQSAIRSENLLTTEHTESHGTTRKKLRVTPCNSVNSVVNKCDTRSFSIFQAGLGECSEDFSTSFSLLDTDNLKSRKDATFAFSILPDALPVPKISAKGLGVACTLDAAIPFSGIVTDDYGVSFTRFGYTITRKEEKINGTIPIVEARASRPQHDAINELAGETPALRRLPLEEKINTIFQPSKANVQLDDTLLLWLESGDGYDLSTPRNPNVAQTPTMTLEIVTPERMRMILEASELNLRRHFETVFDEVKTTRDLFVSISTQKENSEQKDSNEQKANTDEMSVSVRLLHADRAVQNARKNMQEFLAEADAFEDLVSQMVNNHIDTPEWKSRLHDGIAVPLTKIANTSFVELEKRLIQFRTALESQNWTTLPDQKASATAQFESTIAQLDAVLAKMLQMEDFNEAVEQLRSIIQKQEKIESDMKTKQKDSLEDLL